MADDPLARALKALDGRHYEIKDPASGDPVCESDRHAWPCHAHRALAALRLLLASHAASVTREEHDRLLAILAGEEKADG